jgi:nitrogen fixation/metabolism regulation signal transduction histidine kinase
MPLAIRLAFAFVLLAVLTTALAGYGVRTTTREVLESDFDARIEAATREVHEAVVAEARQIRDLTLPLCTKGTFFDKALVDLERAKGDVSQLDTGSRIALRHHLPDEAAARALDELWLVTSDGTVLSASSPKAIGTQDPRLGKLITKADDGAPELSPAKDKGDPSIEVWCSRTVHGYTLGLVGARRIQAILQRVGRAHGVSLSLYDAAENVPRPTGDVVVRTMKLDEVAGLAVLATVPRDALTKTLARLDKEILQNGGVAVLVALVVAIVLGQSLARPIRELAHETREVVTGEPRPVRSRGSKEIRDLAASFNHTIDELTRMRKRLAATERIAARREIARQVAHEIKNPLAPIRAAVETLRRLRFRGDEAFDEYFDEATKTVLEEVHRIANIVSEFTKFSRLPPPNPEPMDLVAAAKGVVALHAADPDMVKTGGGPTQAPRVELSAEEIPEVRADRDQMVQVLTNLVQNGLEAASAVRPDPRVHVSVAKQGEGRVRIVVRDNGPGVAEEMRDKLFEPYATSKATGTGLGLAICQRIVTEHGGEIVYRPATKGGAVFEITLPVKGPSLLDKSIEVTSPTVGKHEPPPSSS